MPGRRPRQVGDAPERTTLLHGLLYAGSGQIQDEDHLTDRRFRVGEVHGRGVVMPSRYLCVPQDRGGVGTLAAAADISDQQPHVGRQHDRHWCGIQTGLQAIPVTILGNVEWVLRLHVCGTVSIAVRREFVLVQDLLCRAVPHALGSQDGLRETDLRSSARAIHDPGETGCIDGLSEQLLGERGCCRRIARHEVSHGRTDDSAIEEAIVQGAERVPLLQMLIQEGEILLAGFGREGRTVRSECERTRSDIHGVHRPMPGGDVCSLRAEGFTPRAARTGGAVPRAERAVLGAQGRQ